eukprot:7924062-Pyramimonas_sp.AAC.1
MEELDREFLKKREPVYEKRDAIFAKIEGLWLNVFLNHGVLAQTFTPDDLKVLEYMDTFKASVVKEEANIKEVFTVTFGFKENPYFTNK